MALPNGHMASPNAHQHSRSASPARSDSDLSEVNDLPTTKPPTTSQPQEHAPSEDEAMQDMATSELDGDDEDAPGEEDADYEMDTAPQIHPAQAMRQSRSPSEESIRATKRKAPSDDEDFMKSNPELYGLRRSGRSRPTRTIVESSEDDDDDDEPNNGRRRKRQKTSGTRPSSSRDQSSQQPESADPESEDDDDVYGGQRGRAFAKQQRKKLKATASGSGTPNLSEVRFSTRRAAQVTTYAEDDQDFDEDEDEDTPQYYYVEEDTLARQIGAILNWRAKEGVTPDPENPDRHDFEFLIKWEGKAHYHAEWQTCADVSALKGYRRLENYFRKIVVPSLQITHDPDMPIEDREKWNLDREAETDALADYMKVERVIGARDGGEDVEYFVKWKALPYDQCTWEQAALVGELAQQQIDRYLDRSSHLPVSNKTESNLATRSDYKPFREQPSYIKGGELRDFQKVGLNFLGFNWCKGNNVILADEMGLGKTVQTVSFMNWLRHDRGQQGPFIVVVPLSTMPAWADTFDNWTPDLNYVVYNGNEASRKIIREHELLINGNAKKTKFNVLLTTYEYILLDSGFLSQLPWQFMAVDEAHRLKNRDSQLYAKLMDFGAPSRLLITGTPMQNTLSELSALMDFLMPGRVHIDEDIDLTSEEASQKLDALTAEVAPYMIRRTKQKVENDLPPKTEKLLRVELSDVQLEYYKNILTRNYAALNAGPKAQKTSLLNIMMELKKASNHPFMFPNAEDRILGGSEARADQLKGLITSSGKMMLLDQLLTKLKKDNHRVLIFSQMVKMLDILGDYLQLRGHQFQRLDGTIAAGPRRMAIDHFNAPDSQDFCFLLSTRAGGLGINLMTADTVILFDSDWNPQADLQAMARAHRIGQKNPVTIYRLVSKNTVEEEVLERARNKLMLEYITIQRGVTDKDRGALSDRINKASATTAEPTSSDDISNILKKRSQKMFEQTSNQRKLEELDIDDVLLNAEEHKTEQPEGMTTDGGEEFLRSFEYTDVKIDLEWDDIIPKDQLEKIKEEERKKAEAAYLESVIEQNAPRKRKAPVDEAREQRAAKKRARDLAAEAAADMGSDNDSDDGSDPKRALSEKECRLLINAYERFGDISEKQDEIIKNARLTGRDVQVVKDTLQEVINTANRLLQAEEQRKADLERSTQKPTTKKDKKAVLFDFRGVKRCNAETLTERPIDMRMIREAVEKASDWKNFRVPEASKPAQYTAEWGAREDGMLCVGMARHGFGAWVDIRDDQELGLQDKFFLEEHRVAAKEDRTKTGEDNSKTAARSPGAVHLVRRANYLISVLKDKLSNGTNVAAKKALENHHRNNRKHMGQFHGRFGTPGQGSSSPRPSSGQKHLSDVRNSSDRRAHGSPNGHRKSAARDDRHRESSQADRKPLHQRHASSPSLANGASKYPDMSEGERKAHRLMERVNREMDECRNSAKIKDKDARLEVIKAGLVAIGNHIAAEMRSGRGSMNEDDLWNYVAKFRWAKGKSGETSVSGSKLKTMYMRIVGSKTKTETTPSASSAKPNGATSEVKAKVEDKAAGQAVKNEPPRATTVKKETVEEPEDGEVRDGKE